MKKALFPIVTEEENKMPFILKSIGTRSEQEHIYRPNGYPNFHWLHCTKGKGELILSNGEYIMEADSGFFMYPGVPHEYYAIQQPWESKWITFSGFALKNTVQLLHIMPSFVFTNLDTSRLDFILDEIYNQVQSFTPIKGFECSHLVYKFLIELKRITDLSVSGNRVHPGRLKAVVEFIESRFNQSPSLEEMASIIHVTPRHLCRLFKETFHMSPFDYLIGYRIKKAKEVLISPLDLTVNEVSQMTGFNNAGYFCAVFKKREGMTPLEFRRMHKFL